ncbi:MULTISPECIES: hypothetical protein [unclassified Variovorax]|uniref:hypothetical protein n=1 Tax=unclassified Variovorax TaxID=663243 RepID=UPI003F44CC32
MTACAECQQLNGAEAKTSPHAQLMRTSTVDLGKASHGRTTGEWQYYFCKICGSNLLQDLDEKDYEPTQWSIVREG